jgi:hypothetical protein
LGFLLWGTLTVINQFEYSWVQNIRKLDFFYLVPRWTFFAPNPGTFDYHIVYRFRDLNNSITNFKEIDLQREKRFSTGLWNPQRRIGKAVLDVGMELENLGIKSHANPENIQLSLSYLILLNFVKQHSDNTNFHYVQFVILKSYGYFDKNKPILILCSAFHRI